MDTTELASEVETISERDPAEFDSRVREEASWLLSALEDGTFDSGITTAGLEYECYAVDSEGELTTLPRQLHELPGCDEEVGRHQIEFQSTPQPFTAAGLETVETEMRARFEAASDALLESGEQLVSDGIWTIPPRDDSTLEYLTAHAGNDGAVLATNMNDCVRYHVQSQSGATRIDTPHVDYQGETVLLNSFTTSIQPHFVVEDAMELPEYFRYALRVAGPLLALGVNSPLFPPDLYDDGVDGSTILDDARMENRISVFESVMNAEEAPAKVAFPEDIDSVTDAVESIVTDPTIVPRVYDDPSKLTHFSHKHGCYWRWIRPVFDEGLSGEANVRIEFRPLPGQPTLSGSIGFVALLAGLLTDFTRRDHPVGELDWEDARTNFYAAAADGLAADFEWIDRNGDSTSAIDEIYADILECARTGLRDTGFDRSCVDSLLSQFESRVRNRQTPARWKVEQVRNRLDDGAPFTRAVHDTQREYVRQQAATFERDQFDSW